jgi:hypothetical protein
LTNGFGHIFGDVFTNSSGHPAGGIYYKSKTLTTVLSISDGQGNIAYLLLVKD